MDKNGQKGLNEIKIFVHFGQGGFLKATLSRYKIENCEKFYENFKKLHVETK